MASDARGVFKAADVVATFRAGAATCGFPAQLLTDNGAVFTAVPRKGRCAIEAETARLGIRSVHSSPYHPQTCGKVERFHQTLKKWLAKQPAATSVAELQIQLNRFAAYYNTVRPHRAIGTAHACRSLLRPTQGGPVRSSARGPPALPGATRQG